MTPGALGEQIWMRLGRPNPAPTPIGFGNSNKNYCIEATRITFPRGLHARASAAIVRVVAMFDSEVFITVDGITVNATRILGLLMLTAGPGTEILIEAQGPEAEVALKEVTRLINHSMSY